MCVCVCARACARACIRACVCVRTHSYMCVCARVYGCVCVGVGGCVPLLESAGLPTTFLILKGIYMFLIREVI